MNISISELARRLGQSPQNFGKKLKRETITLEELKTIADVLDVKFEQAFILPDGNEIKIGNDE
jgi:transcriptional regulator with XRE-family HTH domain